MEYFSKKLFNNYLKIGKFSFLIGLFLLPSAISVSIIFLLTSLLISFLDNLKKQFDDKINLIFLISCLLLLLSSIYNFFDKSSINNISNNSYLTFVGLLNWIPLIFAFIGFQKYLIDIRDRKRCIEVLILGSIPVLFSCFGQLLLNWYGPMKTLFGFITWYQRPIEGITGITGLFNNPNYLAAWLNIIWPFCLVLIFFDKKDLIKNILKISLIFSISLLIILASSRAGWVCLLIPLFFIYGSKIKIWIYSFLSLFSLIAINLYFPIFGMRFQIFIQQLIPRGIWMNFTDLEYENLDISRIGIWRYAFKFISERPIWGHGSRSFTSLLLDDTGFWKGHSHNLPLELIVNYGLPAALFILLPISYLLYKSFYKLYFENYDSNKFDVLDRAWIISLTSLIFMHLVDIQYFDGRISIAGWVLLAGIKNILLNDANKNTNQILNS